MHNSMVLVACRTCIILIFNDLRLNESAFVTNSGDKKIFSALDIIKAQEPKIYEDIY